MENIDRGRHIYKYKYTSPEIVVGMAGCVVSEQSPVQWASPSRTRRPLVPPAKEDEESQIKLGEGMNICIYMLYVYIDRYMYIYICIYIYVCIYLLTHI